MSQNLLILTFMTSTAFLLGGLLAEKVSSKSLPEGGELTMLHGTWHSTPAPTTAPLGTACWVFVSADQRFSGPVCDYPRD